MIFQNAWLNRRCTSATINFALNTKKGIFDEGDQNHPKYNGGFNYATGQYVQILGYTQTALLSKQYR